MIDQPTDQELKDVPVPVVRVVTVTELAVPDPLRVVRAAALAGWVTDLDLVGLPTASPQQQTHVAAAALEWLLGGQQVAAGAQVLARHVQAKRLKPAHGHHLHHSRGTVRDLTDQVLNA